MKKFDKNIHKILEVCKRYPVIAARKLLNIRLLPYYQQDMIERMWFAKYPLLVCSRRTGKTFCVAVVLTLKGLLYPYTKVGIVAPVYRQAKTVFKEVEDLRKRSPFFASQSREPKHGNSEWVIDIYKNNSSITALPLSDNVRSKGFNIVHKDMWT